jgi:hypothetical protein
MNPEVLLGLVIYLVCIVFTAITIYGIDDVIRLKQWKREPLRTYTVHLMDDLSTILTIEAWDLDSDDSGTGTYNFLRWHPKGGDIPQITVAQIPMWNVRYITSEPKP